MATMTKTQRDAVLRQVRKVVENKKKEWIESHPEKMKLTMKESRLFSLNDEYNSLDLRKEELRKEMNNILKELNIPNLHFYYCLKDREDYIKNYKEATALPEKLKNFNINDIEDKLILYDLKEFNLDDFIINVIADLDD